MKISFNTRIEGEISGTNGYGYATQGMLKSLDSLGYQVNRNDSSADVGIVFDQPQHAKWYGNQYKILYHPWESTQLLPGWSDIMNQCDEIWTPSPLIADWYTRYAGIRVPVHVYEHGVEKLWTPVKREPENKIKFLHVGAEATRKGGWDTVRAFRRAFGGRDDVSLTMKMVNSSWNNIPSLGKVKYINAKYSLPQLINMFHYHDVYVYPSFGEGFGLTPLQAMATAMPTITVPAWAPYKRFLDPKLEVSSELVSSPWKEIHPGKILRPDFDEVIDRMRYAADNYDSVRDYAVAQAREVARAYDWDTITSKVFDDLAGRLNK